MSRENQFSDLALCAFHSHREALGTRVRWAYQGPFFCALMALNRLSPAQDWCCYLFIFLPCNVPKKGKACLKGGGGKKRGNCSDGPSGQWNLRPLTHFTRLIWILSSWKAPSGLCRCMQTCQHKI